jgi:hypothetical protein
VFLVGGPAFAGKTLLAHLLNQDPLVCLDEPDFHTPLQSHRGMSILRELFPGRHFPDGPAHPLTYAEAVELMHACQACLGPYRLGMKTADWTFLEYAQIYARRAYPVIAVVRDIRDALVESPLPQWVNGESALNARYRLIWRSLPAFDLWVRYEDLVTHPEQVLRRIARLLSCDLTVRHRWDPESVHRTMLKLERHQLLRSGRISTDRVGIWRTSGRTFSRETQLTATMMGY